MAFQNHVATHTVSIEHGEEIHEFHGPNLDYEPDPRGCGAMLFEKFDQYAEKICQIYAENGEEETFASVKIRSVRAALEMRDLGITKGDVVMQCNYNTLDAIIPLLSTLYLGGVNSNLDPCTSVRDMAHLIGLVKPKLLFTCEDTLENIEEALKLAKLEVVLVVFGKSEKHLQFSRFQQPRPDEDVFEPVVVDREDVAAVMFSSGTTGLPKGLALTHSGLMIAAMSLLEMGVDYTSILHLSTFYWVSAVNLTFVALMMGGRRILCPPGIDDKGLFKIIQDYKVTYSFLASPKIYKLDESVIGPYDTSNFRVVVFGGGPVGNQIPRLRKLLPHTKISIGYGQTEVSGYLSGYHTDNDFTPYEARPTSCGYPAPGITMRIVDPETEKCLGPNQKGEIRYKTRSVFKGFYNSETQGVYDDNGFLKSGDIGFFDEENFLYVVDRIKEMFKYQSYHIVPASLESVIIEHPAVAETIVIGIPNEVDGDHPAALVVLKEGWESVREEDIKSFVEERVIDREKLRGGVVFVKSTIKTPTGKYLRRKMREKVLSGEMW